MFSVAFIYIIYLTPYSDDAASEPVQKEEAPDRGTFENGVFDDLVDHALRDALSHNRHRHAGTMPREFFIHYARMAQGHWGAAVV